MVPFVEKSNRYKFKRTKSISLKEVIISFLVFCHHINQKFVWYFQNFNCFDFKYGANCFGL